MKDIGAKLTLFLTFCAAALLLVATCYAQQGPPPQGGSGGGPGGPPSAQQELAQMTKALTLTEAQSRAILPILEDRHQAIGTLMQNGSSREANQTQMHTIMDTTNKEIRVLLTEDQQKLFDQMRPPRPPSGDGAPPSTNGNEAGPPPSSPNEDITAPPQPF